MKYKVWVAALAALFLFLTGAASAAYQINTDPAAPAVNNPITVTVLNNSSPEPGILVQFVLNGGTPVLNTTDSQGKARFTPLVPGNLDVRATTMNGVPLANRSVSVAPAEVSPPGTATYQITLEPVVPVVNSPVTTTVLKNGSPEPGILVQFVLNGGTPILNTTDSQGKARFTPLISGTLDIHATTMDGVPLANRSVPVIDIQSIYGVDLSVDVQAKTVPPGVNATYVITVSNKGNVTDTYDLAVENKNNAKVAILSGSSVLLDAGESTTVSLDVGSDGTGTFVVEISATSLGNSGIVDSVTTTTTVTEPAPTTPAPTEPPAAGPSGGGGGGGGGGASGETFSNIELKESYDEMIFKDIMTSYRFRHERSPIRFVNITGSINAGLITTTVEVLKGTSILVKEAPPGIVFKNVNVWVGTAGFAVPRNIKEAEIVVRVEKSWLSANDLDNDDMKMLRWDGKAWIELETDDRGEDATFIFFKAKTNAFSPFAMVGVKESGGPAAGAPPVPALPVPTQVPASKPKGSLPGFELVMAAAALSAIYLFRRKIT